MFRNGSGSGYSTADRFGYIEDEDQMAADFFGFLANFIKVFPAFAKRPLYLTGESYAGTYIVSERSDYEVFLKKCFA